jgi:hypothetical protein
MISSDSHIVSLFREGLIWQTADLSWLSCANGSSTLSPGMDSVIEHCFILSSLKTLIRPSLVV